MNSLNMPTKIIFWHQDFLTFLLANSLQKKINGEFYAIFDVPDRQKLFFQKQKLVDFKKIWFFHDSISKPGKKVDMEYLNSFEEKYNINLWLLALNERLFNEYNEFYKFSREEILSILVDECKLFEKILEIKPKFLITVSSTFHHHELFYQMCRARGVKTLVFHQTVFGFKCVIGVGGTTPKTIDTHHMMRLSRHYGADIENVAGLGYTVSIDSGLKKKVISKNGYMLIKFGNSAATNPESIFDSVANQVKNIPDKLDNIVISVGSGIQFAGIIKGIEKFKKKVKRIIGVTFVDRSKKIDEYLNQFSNLELGFKNFQDYEMHLTPYAYSKPIWEKVGNGYIDDIYEGKAHKWMRENVNTQKEKTLFWSIGRRLSAEEVDKLSK